MTIPVAPLTIPEAVAAVLAQLLQFGPPSAYAPTDPDSVVFVAHGLLVTMPRLVALVGADAARRDEAKRLLRAGVAACSKHPYDAGQADRLCRAVQRGWMVHVIQKHPRAEKFGTLCDALRRGRYSAKQLGRARKLIAEVG